MAASAFTPLGLGLLVIIAILPLIPPFNQQHIMRWLITGAFLGAQAVAFDFTAGFINVVNFGFAALLGLGAYTSALFSNTAPYLALRWGMSPWITILMGALAAGIVGLLLGMLTLRLRGIYAAVMAWFVGIALMGLANNLTTLTRGSMGLHPKSLLATTDNLPYFYIILAMLLLTYIVLNLVTKSHFGLAFRAIGQNTDAARASGINPTRYKVFNFALSCAFAGSWAASMPTTTVRLTPNTLMAHFQDGRGARHRLYRRPRHVVGRHSVCLPVSHPDGVPAVWLPESTRDSPGHLRHPDDGRDDLLPRGPCRDLLLAQRQGAWSGQ